MRQIFLIAIMATTISFSANAQTEPGFGLPVLEKGPTINKVIECSRIDSVQLTLLLIKFESDEYPVSVLFHGDTLAQVSDPSVNRIEVFARYTRTEMFRRSYDLHVASKAGSKYLGTMEFSLPSVADALK